MNSAYFHSAGHAAFRAEVRDFVEKQARPMASEWEQSRHFPRHLLKELGSRGWLGLSLPVACCGLGKDPWHDVILAEELARSESMGWVFSVLVLPVLSGPLLALLGTAEHKSNILKPALAGECFVALGSTEVVSGSDTTAIQTIAHPSDNDHYVVNGGKRYITNGSVARYVLTLVRTTESADAWSAGLLIVPTDLPGVVQRKLDSAVMRTGDWGVLEFRDCRVPKRNLLGDPQKGFLLLNCALQRERLMAAVAHNALAAHVLERTGRFLTQRRRFGSPLSEKQAIQHTLADLQSRLEAARHFAYAVCDSFFRKQPVDREIAMLKMVASELCVEVIQKCAHLHGAEALLETHWLVPLVRDTPALTIAAGTTEIMRNLVAAMDKSRRYPGQPIEKDSV